MPPKAGDKRKAGGSDSAPAAAAAAAPYSAIMNDEEEEKQSSSAAAAAASVSSSAPFALVAQVGLRLWQEHGVSTPLTLQSLLGQRAGHSDNDAEESSEGGSADEDVQDPSLERVLEANDLMLHKKDPIPSDGNCFPAAVAFVLKQAGVTKKVATPSGQRKAIVAFLRDPDNAALEALQGITYRQMGRDWTGAQMSVQEWTSWLETMAQSGEWMEGACIFAAAAIAQRHIVLLTNSPLPQNEVLIIAPHHLQVPPNAAPIVLAHYLNMHFTVPLPMQQFVRVRPVQSAKSVAASASPSSASSSSTPYFGGRTIAVYNYKGGVAKTTSTINLATSLAMQGKRVAIIDADPQCNCTTFFHIDQRAYKKGDDAAPAAAAPAVQLGADQQRVRAAMAARAAESGFEPSPLRWDHVKPGVQVRTPSTTSHPLQAYTTPNLYSAMSKARQIAPSAFTSARFAEHFVLQSIHVDPEMLAAADADPSFTLFLMPGNNQVVELERDFSDARANLAASGKVNALPSIRAMIAFKK